MQLRQSLLLKPQDLDVGSLRPASFSKMAPRTQTTREGLIRVGWAILYRVIAQPLVRMGDQAFNTGLKLFNLLSAFDDMTKAFQKYCDNKAWPPFPNDHKERDENKTERPSNNGRK